jgi:sialate O-acetylesterase
VGPRYLSHRIEGDKVRVSFSDIGGGLEARGGEPLQGFLIAGEDQVWQWADAKIDGGLIVVSSANVPKPAAVRYAWSNDVSWANLFNKAGLPALTFRTDAWPQPEAPKKK